jgi:hypothetical protein
MLAGTALGQQQAPPPPPPPLHHQLHMQAMQQRHQAEWQVLMMMQQQQQQQGVQQGVQGAGSNELQQRHLRDLQAQSDWLLSIGLDQSKVRNGPE